MIFQPARTLRGVLRSNTSTSATRQSQRTNVQQRPNSTNSKSSPPPKEQPTSVSSNAPSRNFSSVAPAESAAKVTIPGPAWAWLEPLRPLAVPFQAYGRLQAKRPYVTQVSTATLIYYLGDMSAQHIAEQKPWEQHDWSRTARSVATGMIAAIPGYHWFLFLGDNFNYKNHLLSLTAKIIVNQSIFTPVFNSYFFGMQTLLAGGSAQDVVKRIGDCVPESWVNSLKLWPAVTAFSFTFVARSHRAVFAGFIAIGWQTYLNILNQRKAKAESIDA